MIERRSRELEGLVRAAFGALLDAGPGPTGYRVTGWDVEQGLRITIARADTWIVLEFSPWDGAVSCHARTVRFNVHFRYAHAPERALAPRDEAAAAAVVRFVGARERALPVLPRETVAAATDVREIEVTRMLMAESPGHYYLNAYVGCMIGCEFCDVAPRADFSRSLEGRAAMPWGRYVDVKVNGPRVVRDEVRHLPPGIVRMSPILTDPYQPLEKRYRITRGCLEALLGTGFTPVVLTRAGRVEEDVPLLARFPRAAMGVSIPTDDDAVRAIFEPGGDPIEMRIAALAAGHRAGLRTVAVVQPVLPMNPEALAERIAPFVHTVRIDRMHHAARVAHRYAAAGVPGADTDEFYRDTAGRLEAALHARGVRLDGMDDLTGLFG